MRNMKKNIMNLLTSHFICNRFLANKFLKFKKQISKILSLECAKIAQAQNTQFSTADHYLSRNFFVAFFIMILFALQ